MTSTCVQAEELGKVYAVQSAFENLLPISITQGYASLWSLTDSTMPGAVFFLSAGLSVIALSLSVYVLISLKGRKIAELTKPTTSEETGEHRITSRTSSLWKYTWFIFRNRLDILDLDPLLVCPWLPTVQEFWQRSTRHGLHCWVRPSKCHLLICGVGSGSWFPWIYHWQQRLWSEFPILEERCACRIRWWPENRNIYCKTRSILAHNLTSKWEGSKAELSFSVIVVATGPTGTLSAILIRLLTVT